MTARKRSAVNRRQDQHMEMMLTTVSKLALVAPLANGEVRPCQDGHQALARGRAKRVE